MRSRILLVEDDDDLREAMRDALVADGHDVDGVADGQAAIDALSAAVHEVVLLDVGLGAGLDGVEVCRRIRLVDGDAYVMMLTARDEEPAIVLALEAGADDYVTKPIGIVELRSRVRAALRRVRRGSPDRDDDADRPPEPLAAGDLSVDVGARVARVGDTEIALTRSELTVLETLLRAGGAVLSRDRLTEAIYGDSAYRDPRNIDVHVHHLRGKIADAGGDPSRIATVREAGYRLMR